MAISFRKGVGGAAVAALLAQSMSITGCVSSQEARIGPNDGSDVCYPQRIALDETRGLFAGGIMQSILSGDASAATKITEAILSSLDSGFFSKLMQEQGRDKALENAAAGAKKENENLKRTQAAMDALTKCRKDEIKTVKADYRAKRISKKEGEQRLAAIRTRMDRDYEIAQAINADITKRGGEYKMALGEANASGKGAREKQFASETSSVLTRGQGVGKSTQAMADVRNEAGGLESEGALPTSFFARLFG